MWYLEWWINQQIWFIEKQEIQLEISILTLTMIENEYWYLEIVEAKNVRNFKILPR